MAEIIKVPVRVIPEEPAEAEPIIPDPAPRADTLACDPSAPHNAEIEQLEKERDRYLGLARRTQIEFDEYRERTRRELAEAQADALSTFLKTFLPAFDDLDRVIAEGSKEGHAEDVLLGVRLARGNLWDALREAGVLPVSAETGQAFDPSVHEAIATRCQPEASPGTIVEVFQHGFRLGDKLLRPAKVIVAAPGDKTG